MGYGKTLGIIIPLITIVAIGYVLYINYPQFEVKMKFTDENLINTHGVEALIANKISDSFFYTPVCFEVTNKAESLFGYEIPANNFGVSIKTNDATCKNCDIGFPYDVLSAQSTKGYCKEVKVEQSNDKFSVEIHYQWTALGLSPKQMTVYDCNKVGELTTRNNYTCNMR